MFRRRKTQQEEPTSATPREGAQTHGGAKNRPTPKRREQQAARKRPLVVPGDKAARRAEMARSRAAMLSGDERYLPARDKGPVKRYIRDYIDARWGVAEFMLPVMLIVLALSFIRTPLAMLVVGTTVYGLMGLAVLDTFFMWRRVKKALTAKFGPEAASQRGLGFYAAMRAFQIRRTRMPRPVIKRGEFPT